MHKFDSVITGALDIAQSEAYRRKNTELAPAHLLWGLIKSPASIAAKQLNIDESAVSILLDKLATTTQASQDLRPNSDFAKWITFASSHAVQAGRDEIAETDILRYLPEFFADLNIDFSQLSEHSNDTEIPEFLIDLNDMAKKGKLDPVIGRHKEIRAVMEILGRRSKNNPVLVGPAGVGKTAIVEGLAEAIVKGDVAEVLKGKTIYSLNLGQLMAGTKFRGEFEERLQGLLSFMKEKAGEAIIFIDEIHQLVGAGKTDGAMDAANLLKPALARGELHCIGATTEDEYQKYILGDSALDRRFRSVPVLEPSKEDAIEIILGIKDKLEIHHGIKISDEAIYNAVILSDQYITDKNLPDKAIDLVDEASSALKLSAEAMPSDLVALQADIRSKKILAQVNKADDEMLKDIETMEADLSEKKKVWSNEVESLRAVSDLKNQIDKAKFELEQAERTQDYEEASRIKYSVLPDLESSLMGLEHNWILDKTNIASVISRQTGVPVEKILQSKDQKILELESHLKTNVFGQDESLKEIAETLVTSYAGLTDETRPLGSFLLKGPSGVGKTETAKQLCNFLFGSEKNLIRLDMSEFSEKHSVAKLIGAPAGYIGHDDGGVLTEAVRRRPYSVILLDELEKANPDFSDILLQILDDGRLTDNKGRTINFKNTVILMTTNSRDLEMDFKPEVLGRIDSIVDYKTLDNTIMTKLIDKQVGLLNERLKARNIKVKLGTDLSNKLSELGYDERYGARPLQTQFNRLVIRPLSKLVVNDSIDEGEYTISQDEAGDIILG